MNGRAAKATRRMTREDFQQFYGKNPRTRRFEYSNFNATRAERRGYLAKNGKARGRYLAEAWRKRQREIEERRIEREKELGSQVSHQGP